MPVSAHWSQQFAFDSDAGFDPRLERLREAAQRLRLYRPKEGERADLAALIGHLEQVFQRRVAIHAPFTPECSFDENWLCALFGARQRLDVPSYRFLLQSRMSQEKASEAHFLVCRAQLALDAG